MNDTTSAGAHQTDAFGTQRETPWRRSWWSTITWEWLLIGVVAIAALAIIVVAAVLLFMGLLEMIAIVSPVIIAILLAWTLYLTLRLLRVEKQLKDLRQQRA